MNLHQAAREGNLNALLQLIHEGANFHAEDQYGYTPLYWAALGGHTATAVALIEKGAEALATDRNSNRLFAEAIRKYNLATSLTEAIRNNNLATALAIIHYGKVHYTDITVIENNPTSEYIQGQYKLANHFRIVNYARGLFFGMNASFRDTLMVKIKIHGMSRGGQPYLKIMSLLHDKHKNKKKAPSSLAASTLTNILQYAGLLPSNLDLDLEVLSVNKKKSAADLATKAMNPTYAPTGHVVSSVRMTRRC